jgi:hypothetical protein
MNYEKNYYDYISYVKTLNRSKNKDVYYEEHHIIPRSMGGNNNKENKILLTAREHYLAHYLLWKIHNNSKMMFAFWFINNDRQHKVNSKFYEKAKMNLSLLRQSEVREKNAFFGKKHSEETKQKMKEKALQRLPMSNETRQKLSISLKGKIRSEETKQKMRKPKSEEHKQHIGDFHKRRIMCVETNQIFGSLKEAALWCNLRSFSTISECLNKRRNQKCAGRHPETGQKLHWEFV